MVYVVLDEFPSRPDPKVRTYMVCLQETAVSVSVQNNPKRAIHQNAAACVSLSNSTMSKTRAGFANPTNLTPGGRRRRLSREPPDPCQPGFSAFFAEPGQSPISAKRSPLGLNWSGPNSLRGDRLNPRCCRRSDNRPIPWGLPVVVSAAARRACSPTEPLR